MQHCKECQSLGGKRCQSCRRKIGKGVARAKSPLDRLWVTVRGLHPSTKRALLVKLMADENLDVSGVVFEWIGARLQAGKQVQG